MRTNTNHAKKLLPLLFTMLLPLLASAQTKVEIDGIWYNLVSKLNQAEVTFKGDSYDSYRNEYSGSITIPATITYNGAEYDVTSIGENAFYGCSSLTTIIIPEGIISIGNHAFDKCGLTAINIPEGVTSIGEYAFYGCSSLTNITIPESVTIIGDYAFYCCSVTNITIPEGVANIGRSAFQYCSKLISITISGSVKNIGVSAFAECSKLNNVTMLEGVKSIENDAFYKCSNLTYISLPKSLESIDDRAFAYCSSLESINIPDSLTSIGYCAFYGCGKLNDVHINCIETWCKINFVSSGLFGNTDYTSNPLYYADNLYLNGKIVTKVTIPEGMTSIGRNAFYRYNKLTDITIPNGVTSIGDNAFYGCSNLISVNFPEVVKYIGEKAFYGCSNLTTITIPKGERLWIQSSAFEGCSSLTSIVLPQDIELINSRAFSNCPELTDVYCFAVNLSGRCSDNAFDGSLIEYATLHIPENAIESYKSTVPWSSFGNIVSLDAAITLITLSQSSVNLTEDKKTSLTITTTPENADRNLISWSSSNPNVATVDNTGKVTAVAPGTATITATANDGSGVSASCEVIVTPASYVIKFLIDGEVFLMDTLTRGTAITLPEAPTMEGYTFSGWGEVPETMPANDLTISGTFIVNKYVVNFKVGDEVIASESLEYGASIVAPEAPEKVGYTFNGWGEVAETVPAHDVTYEGSYSINSYTLTYVVDGEAVLTLPILYGGSIPSLKVRAKEGYTFSGWSEIPETMPANDVTIEGTFTQLPSVYLTINQADNGNVKQHLTTGTICTFTIVAAEGWKIHSVTFNGEDVTTQLTAEGIFTTPALSEDAVLNIAYEKIEDDTMVENACASRIKVQGHRGTLRVTGATEGDDISVYTTDGILVAQQQSRAGEAKFIVDTNQVYLVHIVDMVVKIGM